MDITTFASDSELKDGIYFSKNQITISYPERGNQDCFEIEDNNFWFNEDVDAGHYRRYTTKTINQKLIKNGFEIVYSSYIFSILPLTIFLIRSLPSKLGLNKTILN
jgi:hypothetical protein